MTTRGRLKSVPEDRVSTAVRIPRDLYKRARHEALDRDISVNHLIVKGLQKYLDELKPIDEMLP